ncbi:putative adhesin [Actinoplanes sp. NBRC 103695]|uniref:putative adhesin n=1 Tax=Actinoplanes sp. NBRC 103695 TaxID=3032202 RepID=UPI0024A422A1|nr:hypothetical protein [Actinoplanes sp. NBRC 103695]GLZ00379.1 hypothetical protein Acsp02_76310 [Actinoplanes sp. NBRC 103695]
MAGRVHRRSQSETGDPRPAGSEPLHTDGGHRRLLRLQRTAGNQAVAALLGERATVQRTAAFVNGAEIPGTRAEDTTMFNAHRISLGANAVSHADLVAAFGALPHPSQWDNDRIIELQAGPLTVVAGHGRYSDENTKRLKRAAPAQGNAPRSKRAKVEPFFAVPAGMQITMYGPPGTAMDDSVGHQVELGNFPGTQDLKLAPGHGGETKPMPPEFPKTYQAGDQVLNYTVSHPGNLQVVGTSYTVNASTLLSDVMNDLQNQGFTHVHYACCGSAYSEKGIDLKYFGYYIKYRAAVRRQLGIP